MKNVFLALAFAILIAGISSCSNDTATNPLTNLTSKSVSFAPDSVNGYMFSFEKDAQIDKSKKTSTEWDLLVKHAFGGGRTQQIDAFINSGDVNIPGHTQGYVVDTTFDNVSYADDSKLRADSNSTSGRILSIDLTGKGMFNYNPTTHVISPNAQKTLILKTTNNAYYKMQFVSLQTPASKDSLSTFSIRYTKGDGKRLK